MDELDTLLTSIDRYLSDHPPVSAQLVSRAVDMCAGLDNDQLTDQCGAASDGCRQALELLNTRRVSVLCLVLASFLLCCLFS